jgi:DNA repair protein RecO (recombination protein O)
VSLVTTRAILLRSFPYSESSRVLRFYSDTLGSVGVMARGVRAGSGKTGSGLDTFAEGTLTLYVKPTRDLQTLRDFAPQRPRRELGADVRRFGGASVLCEIVLKHAGEEPNPSLYDALASGLDRLNEAPSDLVIPTLLREGWGLVATLGYRPVLEACVECGSAPGDAITRFDFAAGGIRCESCSRVESGPRLGPGARAQLVALLDGGALPALERPRAHLRLLADFVTYHLSDGRPLGSFDVLAGLMPDPPKTEGAEGIPPSEN